MYYARCLRAASRPSCQSLLSLFFFSFFLLERLKSLSEAQLAPTGDPSGCCTSPPRVAVTNFLINLLCLPPLNQSEIHHWLQGEWEQAFAARLSICRSQVFQVAPRASHRPWGSHPQASFCHAAGLSCGCGALENNLRAQRCPSECDSKDELSAARGEAVGTLPLAWLKLRVWWVVEEEHPGPEVPGTRLKYLRC